jgi:hypothetical protein
MSDFLLFRGERGGSFSVNSRERLGKKYLVSYNVPFEVSDGDLWIASLPGMTVLSEVSFVPTTIRVPNPDETYLSKWEASFLEGLASSTPNPSRIVEVGTGKGISLARLLLGLSLHTDAKVWSIDLLECEKAKEYVQSCQIPNWRYALVVGDSAKIGCEWNEPLDMVYLDGSHAYEGVLKDVEVWSPFLKAGGIMAFHDYGNRKHRVTAAVDKAMKGKLWAKVGRVGYLVAFEKGKEHG